MAQLAISAVGAFVGFWVGGPAGASYGWMAGSMLGAAVTPGTKTQGPRLSDLKVTGTEYGSTIPWVAGTPRIAGQIIWASDRRETATEQEQGKGGGPSSTSYTYDVDLLILLSENEISGVKRIWSSGELVFDGTTAQDGLWSDLRVYTGDENQMPDPTYEAAVGVGNAPAYRGMGTLLIQGLQLGNGGNIPNLTFEISAGAYVLKDVLLHDFTGFYDQGQGAFCSDPPHNYYPLNETPVHTVVPRPAPGEVMTITKTLFVQPGGRLDFILYHDDTCKLFINEQQIETRGISYYVSSASFVPDGDVIRIAYEVKESLEVSPNNQRFLAFKVTQEQYKYQGADGEPAGVDGVMVALLIRAGYSRKDFDVSGIDAAKLVRAMASGQVSNTRAIIEPIQLSSFLEVSADERIRIRERALDPVATVNFSDLGMTESGGDDEPFTLALGNDIELPAQLALSYLNMAGDYQVATEFSDRILTDQQSTEAVQLALGLNPPEAKAIVDGMLMDRVASLASTKLLLPLKYSALEPGDVINVAGQDGRTYRLRINSRTDFLPILEFHCVLDDVGAIESSAVTDDGYVNTETVIQPAGTAFAALDIPILRDADDAPGFYLAFSPVRASPTDRWSGAIAAQSWDGVNYSHILQTTGQTAIGTAQTALPDWKGGVVFDESSTVIVNVSAELASSTRDQMLLDETINALLIGSEIIRFRSAELLAKGRYLISGLLRGQRGTEWAMGTHAAGERCVRLDNGLRRAPSQTNEIGIERQIKAVTIGAFLSSGTPEDFTDTGVGLKPFSPANPAAVSTPDGIVVSWTRRTRRSYSYSGASPSVPLGEAFESYRVRVIVGGALKREEITGASKFTYTKAMQTADSVLAGTVVNFEISQRSEIVGPGYQSTVGVKA